jgi:hypothetical protein
VRGWRVGGEGVNSAAIAAEDAGRGWGRT